MSVDKYWEYSALLVQLTGISHTHLFYAKESTLIHSLYFALCSIINTYIS